MCGYFGASRLGTKKQPSFYTGFYVSFISTDIMKVLSCDLLHAQMVMEIDKVLMFWSIYPWDAQVEIKRHVDDHVSCKT